MACIKTLASDIMGSACSVSGTEHHAIERGGKHTNSVQDEAFSFQGKTGALRVIIHTEGARKAFSAFLEEEGKSSYLQYWTEIDDMLKSTHNDDTKLVETAAALLKKYNPNFCDDPVKHQILENIWSTLDAHTLKESDLIEKFKTSKSTEKKLLISDIHNHFKSSETEVLNILANDLDKFLKSTQYAQWQQKQKSLQMEKMKSGIHREK